MYISIINNKISTRYFSKDESDVLKIILNAKSKKKKNKITKPILKTTIILEDPKRITHKPTKMEVPSD